MTVLYTVPTAALQTDIHRQWHMACHHIAGLSDNVKRFDTVPYNKKGRFVVFLFVKVSCSCTHRDQVC